MDSSISPLVELSLVGEHRPWARRLYDAPIAGPPASRAELPVGQPLYDMHKLSSPGFDSCQWLHCAMRVLDVVATPLRVWCCDHI